MDKIGHGEKTKGFSYEDMERIRGKVKNNRRTIIRKMKITIIKNNFEHTESSEGIIKEFQILDNVRFLALRFEDDSIVYENLDGISTFSIEVVE